MQRPSTPNIYQYCHHYICIIILSLQTTNLVGVVLHVLHRALLCDRLELDRGQRHAIESRQLLYRGREVLEAEKKR